MAVQIQTRNRRIEKWAKHRSTTLDLRASATSVYPFSLSRFVFKHVYDLKEGKKQNMSPKVCICFAIVTLPTNSFCLDILKGHGNIPIVVFLGQNGVLAEVSIRAVPQSLHVAAYSTLYMSELRWEKLPKRWQWKKLFGEASRACGSPGTHWLMSSCSQKGFAAVLHPYIRSSWRVALWPVAMLLAVAKVVLLVSYLVANESSDIWNLVSIHFVSVLRNNFLWVCELPVFSKPLFVLSRILICLLPSCLLFSVPFVVILCL